MKHQFIEEAKVRLATDDKPITDANILGEIEKMTPIEIISMISEQLRNMDSFPEPECSCIACQFGDPEACLVIHAEK